MIRVDKVALHKQLTDEVSVGENHVANTSHSGLHTKSIAVEQVEIFLETELKNHVLATFSTHE